jgi:hypothetical protein
MKNNSNAEYLPLRLLFVAYARMLDTRKMFPTVRDYYEKRYRILSGLFEAHLADTLGLDELASRYTRASSIDPCEGVILGSNGIDRLSGYISSMRELRRHAADMRRIYARLGVEWLIEHCPGIEERRVHVSRLKEFGIIPKPPNAVDECFKAMEMDAGEEEPVNDDVPAFVSAELMRGEEEIERVRQANKLAIPIVIERALAAGFGTPETIFQAIYDMNVQDFLKLADGFPKLSRVDFKPQAAR